jgi:hypothetical protein
LYRRWKAAAENQSGLGDAIGLIGGLFLTGATGGSGMKRLAVVGTNEKTPARVSLVQGLYLQAVRRFERTVLSITEN